MSKKVSKLNRKSSEHIGDLLASMNTDTRYLTPIFGTLASDVEMPNKKLNKEPVEPQVTEPCHILPDLYGAYSYSVDGRKL